MSVAISISRRLKFALKQFEPELVLVEGTAWERLGSGDTAAYRVAVTLVSDALNAALSDNEDDAGTQFNALAEFQWAEHNPYGIGPTILRGTSRTFVVAMVRDLIPDA
ncbi:MAG: hypothetical protein WDN28_32320 [Chthoniobacter sp.]